MQSITHHNCKLFTLRNACRVQLKRIGPADEGDLLAGFRRLSQESRYLRFFKNMPELPSSLTRKLLMTDDNRHVAIGARCVDHANVTRSPIVGVARYVCSTEDVTRAEVAVAVVDDLQNQGLGKLLLGHIAEIAERRGVQRFTAVVLPGNQPMYRIMSSFGGTLGGNVSGIPVYQMAVPTLASHVRHWRRGNTPAQTTAGMACTHPLEAMAGAAATTTLAVTTCALLWLECALRPFGFHHVSRTATSVKERLP